MVRLVLEKGFFLTKRENCLSAEAGLRPDDSVTKWVWVSKHFNHRLAILLIARLPQPLGEMIQPGGRLGGSAQRCQCCSA